MNMTIIKAAREKIMEVNEPGHYIKMELVKSGCCSFSFTMYEDVPKKDDILIEVEGLKLLVTPRAKEMLDNLTTEIDYGRKALRKGFWVTSK